MFLKAFNNNIFFFKGKFLRYNLTEVVVVRHFQHFGVELKTK